MPRPVYLVDHCAFRPKGADAEELRVNRKKIQEVWETSKRYDQKVLEFQGKIVSKSGLAEDGTFLPKAINPVHCGNAPRTDLDAAAEECRMVVFGAVEGLLTKLGITAKDVDILVTTCSIYCPTPSMSSLVVNKFKMRPDVLTFHLGGMGCSNGVVAVNLLRDLIKARPNSNVLFITTETTTPAYYEGSDPHRLVTNLIFRMGAAAMLISDKAEWADNGRAKYVLQHNHRVHAGAIDDAYNAIYYGPDSEGHNGVYLGLNVVTEASAALTKALWKVGPRIMNWGQIAAFLRHAARTKLAAATGSPRPEAFRPRFSECVEHFLIHAGGAKVLDGIGKALQLDEAALEPSRAVLHDYGNVSSSTTWYTLGYVESVRGVKAGDKVMQIGVGSGVKAGVNIWKAVRDVRDVHHAWEHRVPEEERVALRRRQQQQQAVDGSHAGSYTLHRLLSLTLLLVLVAAFYVFALQATGGAGLVMGPLAPSNPTLFATAQQRAAPPAAPVFAGGKEL